MALDILAGITAVLLLYLAYRDWYAYQFLSVVSAAIGILTIISLIAIYIVDRGPVNANTPPPPANVR